MRHVFTASALEEHALLAARISVRPREGIKVARPARGSLLTIFARLMANFGPPAGSPVEAAA